MNIIVLIGKLPYGPDEEFIKGLLLKSLESHYGTLEKCVFGQDVYKNGLAEIRRVLEKLPND